MLTYIKCLFQTLPNTPHYFREFKHFLVTEKVYAHFLQNVTFLNTRTKITDFYPFVWITFAFVRSHTPQQKLFWDVMEEKWKSIVSRMREQYPYKT